MKQLIFIELLSKLRAKPHLMRKVKIFAAIGVVGLLIASALVTWVGVSAFSFAANKASEVLQSTQASIHVENLKAEVQEISRIRPLNCWGKAQTLMALEPWLTRPALDNLKNLKVACLEQAPAVCEGDECLKMKQLINTAEGRVI